MAKKRKSIFDAEPPKSEIDKAAKKVQESVIAPMPSKTKREEKKEAAKLVQAWLGEKQRDQAKFNALKRKMTLAQYLDWLIENDDIK